jgi:hypothetical protein
LFKYKNLFRKNYGWDVNLTCSQCKFSGQPRYEGWSPNLKADIAENVTVYAKVACPKCGRRLTDEAGKKLLTLFRDIDIPEQNKRITTRFIARLILVPVALAFVLFFGTQMDWWGWGLGTAWILLVSALSIPLLVIFKNNRIAQLPFQCDCGNPHYVYMGGLDDTSCYRCFSCGRLLKLQE